MMRTPARQAFSSFHFSSFCPTRPTPPQPPPRSHPLYQDGDELRSEIMTSGDGVFECLKIKKVSDSSTTWRIWPNERGVSNKHMTFNGSNCCWLMRSDEIRCLLFNWRENTRIFSSASELIVDIWWRFQAFVSAEAPSLRAVKLERLNQCK